MLRRVAKLLNIEWERVVCAELLLATELAHRSHGSDQVNTDLVQGHGQQAKSKQTSTFKRYAAVGG
jgi:hypothetical protein